MFVPIDGADAVTADMIESWGRRHLGAVGWDDLLERQRVIILAEASSGKTEEFRGRVEALRATGRAAFFAAIETVAASSLQDAFSRRDASAFESWKRSGEAGWFFLDSVDEAKLNHLSLEVALNRFGKELGEGYDRAHVFISCRGSDWAGASDLAKVESTIPLSPPPADPTDADADADMVLLAALEPKSSTPSSPPTGDGDAAPLVVRLVGLSTSQRRQLAHKRGVTDLNALEQALDNQGLVELAERPGDLLLLIDYWLTHGRFGSLTEMMAFSLAERLGERSERRDAPLLTQERARHGAERIAAAMTLCRLTTVRIGTDPSRSGGLDPRAILPEWTSAERAALLRRGVFAPATYGQVRFHHRSAQEYLTGAWLRRRLDEGAPLSEILDLLIVDRYGNLTVPPSLRAAAAWASQHDVRLVDRILDCEPLVLMLHGDPRALTIAQRSRLLTTYARQDARGEVSDHYADRRSLWMFADPELAPAVREAWRLHPTPSFRLELLRLIDQGKIADCVDLARSVACSISAPRYNRIVAARALEACGDHPGLEVLASELVRTRRRLEPDTAPQLVQSCFPQAMSVDDLLLIMKDSRPGREYQVEGFGYALEELWLACTTEAQWARLVAGVADLCLSRPYQDYVPISARHARLSESVHGLARTAILASDAIGVDEGLVRLLQVAERTGRRAELDPEAKPTLRDLVQARPILNRRLFWADVALEQATSRRRHAPDFLWRLYLTQGAFWALTAADDDHLLSVVDDSAEKVASRRMALSALWSIHHKAEDAEPWLDTLTARVAGDPILAADLRAHRTPPIVHKDLERWEKEDAKHRRQTAKRKEKSQSSWIEFRDRVRSAPEALTDGVALAHWPGPLDLLHLTNWLSRQSGSDTQGTAIHWRRLATPFGPAVADAYVRGLKTLWRVVAPTRPTWDDGVRTITHTSRLANAGLRLEASLDPTWAVHLTSDDARLAALHAIGCDHGYAESLDDLLKAHPAIVEPLVLAEIEREWNAPDDGYTPFLYQVESGRMPIGPRLRQGLLELILTADPISAGRIREGQKIARVLDLSPTDSASLSSQSQARLKTATDLDDEVAQVACIGQLIEVDAAIGIPALSTLLSGPAKDEEASSRAERIFIDLFDASHGLAATVRPLNPALAGSLVRLAYQSVRPELDRVKSGMYEPDRHDTATSARSRVLSLLLDQTGEAAYRAVLALAEDLDLKIRWARFRQLARGMAERDAEPRAWIEGQVIEMERRSAAPAQSGADLLRIATGVIHDIDAGLTTADFSSAGVLQTAQNEEAVREWLAEQLHLRSKGRYLVQQEKEISDRDMPDITLVSTAGPFEVAIEVKHGGKPWTLTDLRLALSDQLATRYLRPTHRRHGILVVSHHRDRVWIDPKTGQRLNFAAMLAALSDQATGITRNDVGSIAVRVLGLDAFRAGTKARESKAA